MIRKALFISLALMLSITATYAQSQQQRLEKHVYLLASDSLQGRKAGTDDARKAADYIEHEYQQMGLKPLFDSYQLNFSLLAFQSIRLDADPSTPGPVYRDVIAVIEGNDPKLKNEYIVVGAHYDHLGVKNDKIYNGADDNASGSACVIEIARQLLQHRSELKRSVIICAFDAEEIGLYGSKALAEKLANKGMLGHVKVMMSVDMVGWLKQGKELTLEGAGTLSNGSELLKDVAQQTGLPIALRRFETSPFTATDTEPFAKYHIPTLAITTGLKSPYHKPEDEAHLIDYPGLSNVTDYLSALVLRMASDNKSVEWSGKVAAKHDERLKTFEVAPVIGYNMSNVRFSESMFDCKSSIGLTTGISANWNFARHFGMSADLLYSLSRSPYPNTLNVWDNPYDYHQQSLLVPVQAKIILGNPTMGIHVGFGGYYGYAFARRMGVENTIFANQHQYGYAWSIDVRMANLSMDFSFYTQLNELLPQINLTPACSAQYFTFTLGWFF
ncbi:MAG: M20/M25/M40 family metallo-hydrolase [Bacteroidales bacterium]|nr:M20/M25/M40 family metallo-hydrolase [Bacteroidales bacterium]